jgi:succinate dehydrogenase / fumarate reductase, cytochrome b subunit
MTQTRTTFYSTSVGKKVVMAVTGVIAFGFVLIHMIGNMQIYIGASAINRYSRFLHSLGGGLWAFRIILAAVAVVHIIAATQVTLQSMNARPERYAKHRFRETTYAARTMWWGGPIIALFIIYHLMHLTFGTLHPMFSDNVYNNLVFGFQAPWVSAVYILANVLLGLHLSHGLWSMFQSVGLNHPKWNRLRNGFAILFGFGIAACNISIPVSILAGIVRPV